jgi:hypothetical protein
MNGVRPLPVGVHHVDADTPTADTGDQGAQRRRSATAATDDFSEIVGMHMHLDCPPAPVGHHVHPHIVWIVDDSADEVFDCVDDD